MDILIDYLMQDKDRVVEIETNGSVNIKEYASRKNRASFTMDYKLGASGMEEKMCLENFAYLDKNGWIDMDSCDDSTKWISQYFDTFVSKLSPTDKVTIYECTKEK